MWRRRGGATPAPCSPSCGWAARVRAEREQACLSGVRKLALGCHLSSSSGRHACATLAGAACSQVARHTPCLRPLFLPAVGNFSSCEAAELLGALRRAAGERCQLLLGTDMWKDAGVLRRAYDDAQGGWAQAGVLLG